MAETIPGKMVRDGFVGKQPEVGTGWKKRYLVLTDQALAYYKAKGDEQPMKMIFIKEAQVRDSSAEISKENTFCVFTKEHTFYFACATPQDMTQWMTAFSKAKTLNSGGSVPLSPLNVTSPNNNGANSPFPSSPLTPAPPNQIPDNDSKPPPPKPKPAAAAPPPPASNDEEDQSSKATTGAPPPGAFRLPAVGVGGGFPKLRSANSDPSKPQQRPVSEIIQTQAIPTQKAPPPAKPTPPPAKPAAESEPAAPPPKPKAAPPPPASKPVESEPAAPPPKPKVAPAPPATKPVESEPAAPPPKPKAAPAPPATKPTGLTATSSSSSANPSPRSPSVGTFMEEVNHAKSFMKLIHPSISKYSNAQELFDAINSDTKSNGTVSMNNFLSHKDKVLQTIQSNSQKELLIAELCLGYLEFQASGGKPAIPSISPRNQTVESNDSDLPPPPSSTDENDEDLPKISVKPKPRRKPPAPASSEAPPPDAPPPPPSDDLPPPPPPVNDLPPPPPPSEVDPETLAQLDEISSGGARLTAPRKTGAKKKSARPPTVKKKDVLDDLQAIEQLQEKESIQEIKDVAETKIEDSTPMTPVKKKPIGGMGMGMMMMPMPGTENGEPADFRELLKKNKAGGNPSSPATPVSANSPASATTANKRFTIQGPVSSKQDPEIKSPSNPPPLMSKPPTRLPPPPAEEPAQPPVKAKPPPPAAKPDQPAPPTKLPPPPAEEPAKPFGLKPKPPAPTPTEQPLRGAPPPSKLPPPPPADDLPPPPAAEDPKPAPKPKPAPSGVALPGFGAPPPKKSISKPSDDLPPPPADTLPPPPPSSDLPPPPSGTAVLPPPPSEPVQLKKTSVNKPPPAAKQDDGPQQVDFRNILKKKTG